MSDIFHARKLSRVKRSACGVAALLTGLAIAVTPAQATQKAVTKNTGPNTDTPAVHPLLWPRSKSPIGLDPAMERRITKIIAGMSVEEKVGQVIQPEWKSIKPEEVAEYHIGSIENGGGSVPGGNKHATVKDWVDLIEPYYQASVRMRSVNGGQRTVIPLIWASDAVHGHNNVYGSTLFPHNIGLGAAHDPALIERIGRATAEEVRATGMDWSFAPTIAVARDDRWGRTYESYSEDPKIVAAYAGAMVSGLEGKGGDFLDKDHVISTAKHFLGDGSTDGGRDQGDSLASEDDLIRLHAQGYAAAIDAGTQSIMASYNSWHGIKMHANKALMTDVLKGQMGFDGFIMGDWLAHAQIPGCSNGDCPAAFNAGLDIFNAPTDWKVLYANMVREVKSGTIPPARLDDAVRRILRVKMRAHVFDEPSPAHRPDTFKPIGTPEHRAIARQAVAESLVLLKNNGGVLPIKASAHVLVAGSGADDIGRQSGGWTLNWQGVGNKNSDFPHGQSIFAGIAEAVKAGGGQADLAVDGQFSQKPDVAIVVFGETPYAEFQGDIPTLEYQPGDKSDLALLQRLKAQGVPVVSVFLSGRPLWTNPEINASDAFVAAWLPGSEGGGVADVLIRKPDGTLNHDFRGQLGFSWPKRADRTPGHREEPGYDPQFAYGYGLTYASAVTVGTLSEDPGVRVAGANIDRYFVAGHTPAPWSLSATGAVTVKAVDAGAQENARLAQWSGQGPGAVTISGTAADLSRQTTGDMALMIRYRLSAAPTAPVKLSVSCGANCGAAVDVTSLLTAAADSNWHVTRIKLTCFRTGGADMSKVVSPFSLATDGRLGLTFTELKLSTNEGDAVCPGGK